MTQALALYGPALLIAISMVFYTRLRVWDGATTLLLLLALAVGYYFFYHTNWTEFSVDAESHLTYIRFIREHHRLPVPADGMGAATRHPPAFYLAGAGLLELAEKQGVEDTIQFVRHLPMACYALFLILGTQLLRTVLLPWRGAYLGALLFLLFWPLGLTMGGRISCDILLFAAQAGALAALVRWLAEPTPVRLCASFLWAGVAVMGKNGGVFMLYFALAALAATAWQQRHHLRSLLRADLTGSILFACFCNLLNNRHSWIMQHVDDTYGILYFWEYVWNRMSVFNPFLLLYETDLGLGQESFWNTWLHTLLLGGSTMRWNSPLLVLTCKVVWVATLVYDADGLLRSRKTLLALEKQSLALLAMFTAITVAAAAYLLLRTANPNYADARYAYPAVLGFALLHGTALHQHFAAGRQNLYRLGLLFAASFAALSIALVACQFSA